MRLVFPATTPIEQTMAQVQQIFNFRFIIMSKSIGKGKISMKQRYQKLTSK